MSVFGVTRMDDLTAPPGGTSTRVEVERGQAVTVHQALVGRIRDLTLRAKALALSNSGAKVVFALLSVSVREDGVLVTEVPLTVEQIAERVSVQRETASRALTTLKRKRVRDRTRPLRPGGRLFRNRP